MRESAWHGRLMVAGIVVLIAVGSIIFGVFRRQRLEGGQTLQADAKPKVRIVLPNNAVSTLPLVALRQGFFAEEGVEVEPFVVTNGKMANDTLIAKRAELATAGGSPRLSF